MHPIKRRMNFTVQKYIFLCKQQLNQVYKLYETMKNVVLVNQLQELKIQPFYIK